MTEPDESRISATRPVATDAPMLNRAAWVRILPFLAYVFFICAGDLLERMGYAPADLLWLYPVKIAAVMALLVVFRRHYQELRGRVPGRVVALAAAAGVLVLVLWVSLDAPWMIVGSASGYDPRHGSAIDWPLTLVRIAGAALVVPVMEELFWRSFLMRWIESAEFQSVDPSQLGIKSFVITIFLFGFEHNLWLAGVVAGAVYAWLYQRYRALWAPIVAHGVTNGLLGIWVVATGNWSYW